MATASSMASFWRVLFALINWAVKSSLVTYRLHTRGARRDGHAPSSVPHERHTVCICAHLTISILCLSRKAVVRRHCTHGFAELAFACADGRQKVARPANTFESADRSLPIQGILFSSVWHSVAASFESQRAGADIPKVLRSLATHLSPLLRCSRDVALSVVSSPTDSFLVLSFSPLPSVSLSVPLSISLRVSPCASCSSLYPVLWGAQVKHTACFGQRFTGFPVQPLFAAPYLACRRAPRHPSKPNRSVHLRHRPRGGQRSSFLSGYRDTPRGRWYSRDTPIRLIPHKQEARARSASVGAACLSIGPI